MEVPAFVSPLDEFGVQELGRLAMNFGYVEFLLEHIVAGRAKLLEDRIVRTELIGPLTTRRKLEIIAATNDSHTQNPEATALVKEACTLVEKSAGVRNDVLHGYWSFSTDDEFAAISRSPKRRDRSLDQRRISETADQAARASRLLIEAMLIASGVPQEEIHFPLPLYSGVALPPDWPPESL